MTTSDNSSRPTHAAFTRTLPLCATALLAGFIGLLPVSVLAQDNSPAVTTRAISAAHAQPFEYALVGGDANQMVGIQAIDSNELADVSGKYLPSTSIGVVMEQETGVILWDEGGRPKAQMQSSAGGNQQHNTLNLGGQ